MKARQPDELPVFFDLDGTLAESAGGIVASLEHALAACGVPNSQVDWRRHIGPPLQRMLATALPDLMPGKRDEIVAVYRAQYATVGLFMTMLFPGVAELLQEIVGRGATVYVVTNKPQAPAEAIISHLNLERIVRRIVGGDPAGQGTKAGRAAALVAQEGITGGFFIGDGLDDLAAAERIGARFFLAGWGYGTARVLAERPDVVVLREPADLLPQLQSDRVIG